PDDDHPFAAPDPDDWQPDFTEERMGFGIPGEPPPLPFDLPPSHSDPLPRFEPGAGVGDGPKPPGMIGPPIDGPRKGDLLTGLGGNERSERAVALGLSWLAKHQARDGHWAMDDFQHHVEVKDGKDVVKTCDCEGAGSIHDNIAGTGLALLCFLG